MLVYSNIIFRSRFLLENGVHPLDALMIVLSGEFTCRINKQTQSVRSGDIFIFKKNVKFERHVISPLKCIYIQFDSLPSEQISGKLFPADYIRLKSTIKYLEKSVEEKNNILINHFVDDILICCKKEQPFTEDNIILKCREYFEKNYSRDISLDFLCRKFYISKQGLINKYKRQLNKTPICDLNEIRIEKSKDFLVNTDMSVGAVSEICGFKNMYYFSNYFKKITGLSPSSFRRNLQEGCKHIPE